jgi:hypothetical protein
MAIMGPGYNPYPVASLVISYEPYAILAVFCWVLIIDFSQVFAPSWSPSLILRTPGIPNTYLIMVWASDIEFESPVGMVIMIGVAGQIPTLQAGIEASVFAEIPGLVQVILSDLSVGANLQPLNPVIGMSGGPERVLIAILYF